MDIRKLILMIVVWNLTGAIFIFGSALVTNADGFAYVNPIWIYKHYRVNYFGATLICILYNLLCPIGSICYWFYKLCTVGRKT